MKGNEVEETWDGHHFNDDCSWKVDIEGMQEVFSPKFPLIAFRLLWQINSYFPRDRRYFDKIKAFFAIRPDGPIKTLRDGQQFRVSDYPRGTIIRISKAELMRYAAGRLEGGNYRMWGFIEQERDPSNNQYGDQIIAFPEHHLEHSITSSRKPPQGYMAFRNWHNVFTVGDVIHDRDKIIFGLFREQKLTRYGEVEIWKYGQAVRERVAVEVPGGALQTQTKNA